MILHLKNLKMKTILGVHDWERTQLREILVNAQIGYDASNAAHSDQLVEALDYYTLSQELIQLASKSKFFLLESLTQKMGELLLEKPAVKSVKIWVEKPKPFAEIEAVIAEWEARK